MLAVQAIGYFCFLFTAFYVSGLNLYNALRFRAKYLQKKPEQRLANAVIKIMHTVSMH